MGEQIQVVGFLEPTLAEACSAQVEWVVVVSLAQTLVAACSEQTPVVVCLGRTLEVVCLELQTLEEVCSEPPLVAWVEWVEDCSVQILVGVCFELAVGITCCQQHQDFHSCCNVRDV